MLNVATVASPWASLALENTLGYSNALGASSDKGNANGGLWYIDAQCARVVQ
jgi:hypothetical protein